MILSSLSKESETCLIIVNQEPIPVWLRNFSLVAIESNPKRTHIPPRDELKSYSLIQDSSRTKAGSVLTEETCTLFPSLRTDAKELLADPRFVPLGIKALGFCGL
ncbi:hypothetical protein Tco_1011334 [Tanacetum coccineum]